MTGLTDKQIEALVFADRFIAREGKSPSVREVMIGIDVASSSRAQEVLNALEERGYIERIPRRDRSISIIRRPPGSDIPFPGPPALAGASDEDLHTLRRDLAFEITKRTQAVAIARADAVMAGEGA